MDDEEMQELMRELLAPEIELRNRLDKIENTVYVPNVKCITDFKRACTILKSVFATQIQNQKLKMVCEAKGDVRTGKPSPLSPGYGCITIVAPKIELQNESLTQFANAVSTATSWSIGESNIQGQFNLYLEWRDLYTAYVPVEIESEK